MEQQAIYLTTNIKRRFLAGLFDYAILYGFVYGYLLYFGSYNEEGYLSVSGLKTLPVIVFWFLFIVLIEHLSGATIGNGIMGLKPLSEDGSKPRLSQNLKRHLVDMLDMFFFGLVAVIAIKNTNKKQRLGDLWAGTIVVRT